MQLNDITIGTKLEVSITNDFKDHKNKYISQLEQIVDEHTLIIAVPIYAGNIIAISVGAIVNIVFYNEKGVFSFNAEVKKRGVKDNINVLILDAIQPLKKIQRREYFRFDWVMPVKYKEVKNIQSIKDEEAIRMICREDEDEPFERALTKNISGGGIGIITKKQHDMKSYIAVQLSLNKCVTINVIGKVVRAKLYNSQTMQYDTGILFTHVNPQKRDAIIKFIFEQQIKLKQKGMV